MFVNNANKRIHKCSRKLIAIKTGFLILPLIQRIKHGIMREEKKALSIVKNKEMEISGKFNGLN